MKTTSIAAFLFPFVLLTGGTAAGAGASATRDEQSKACKGDAIHYCAVHIPNKEKIEACMKQHYDQLSPRCKAMFDPPQQQ